MPIKDGTTINQVHILYEASIRYYQHVMVSENYHQHNNRYAWA